MVRFRQENVLLNAVRYDFKQASIYFSSIQQDRPNYYGITRIIGGSDITLTPISASEGQLTALDPAATALMQFTLESTNTRPRYTAYHMHTVGTSCP